MSSPIIPTVDAAMLKAISVASDIHGDFPVHAPYGDTVRAVFRQEITTLKAALAAEDKSREIALAELRKAIDEGLYDFDHDRESNIDLELSILNFWHIVGPWFKRLED